MAFLDNSGDIILDAVLTDLGRKRLAQGNFKISKFALGDDEIDYSLFNRNHASGSAYFDLEIMQTPVFEAFTQTNANINYGLASHTRTDLLYLPILKPNTLVSIAAKTTSSVYYIAVNSETAAKLRTGHSSSAYVLESNQASDTAIVIESGLHTTNLTADATNRSSYIVNTNLLDSAFNVYADGRFIINILTSPKAGYFRNTTDGTAQISLTPLKRGAATSAASVLDNYSTYSSVGISNEVTQNDTVDATTISAINGPRGSVTALNLVVQTEMAATSTGARSSKYDLYGSIDQTIFGGGEKYDYIDTTVYIEGAASTGRVQLPVRIIRYAGT
jgi:hypothetical protein|tara:strand:- start:2575 stop:3570 length:996 start_codon:yes stop_codon:yes gene_type:complete